MKAQRRAAEKKGQGREDEQRGEEGGAVKAKEKEKWRMVGRKINRRRERHKAKKSGGRRGEKG